MSPGDREIVSEILALAAKAAGVDFSAFKTPTLYRRIGHRMGLTACPSLEAYADRLRRDAGEMPRLLDALLIKTTSMFRHPPTFAVLRDAALPRLYERRRAEGASTVRSWVVGCSTGEEAFSIAICLLEMRERHPGIAPHVLASDVDRAALQQLAGGRLRAHSAPPPPMASPWLEAEGQGYRVADAVRSMVTSAYHDILGGSSPAPRSAVLASFDIVSCRNLLIYLEPAAQERVVTRLLKSLSPGGILILGEAEVPRVGLETIRMVSPGIPLYEVD